ncbi:HlyC/CorC family transporter [Campylobacter sp. FMV-PI01]|uniref:HlyC/CorC family transporter n=1 Tax=Campylobacter portucalensis TaxID=2608384 RepID=A0A6L5WJ97_9BACT|nr:hemolysin family protein [Campylobacter portucalensis]MSN95913.1 HlyC/CorC family transporter [Campylobacter portucalensis]
MLFFAFVFILLNAFFVLSEFAIVKVRKSKLEELVQEDVPNAKMAYNITNSLDTYLSATQLGITLSSLALGWIGEPAVARLIESPIKKYFEVSDVFLHSIAFIFAFTLITLLHVVLGELVPKSVAIAKPEKMALFVAKPLHAFWVVFSPFIKVFDCLAQGFLRLINVKPASENEIAHSEEEIKIIAGQSLKGGVLDILETEIIKNAVDFGDTVAKEIMTPRKEMICLNKQKSYEENYQTILNSRYTRFPYIDGSKDNVLGMVHIRDIIQQGDKKDFNEIVRKVIFVPENFSIAKILPMMNKERIFAALVIDEYGGTAGILTMEDIIEEIFGDINDEHDDKTPSFSKIADGVFEFVGRYDIEDVEKLLGIVYDEDTQEITIGGYVFNLLGRLPNVGDIVEDDECIYEVMAIDGRAVSLVKVSKKDAINHSQEEN